MKRAVLFLLLSLSSSFTYAQQFGLTNTRTLVDGFENPAQKTFQVDSSRKYAFNFLIPAVSLHSAFTGPAQQSFKDLVFKRVINGDLPIGQDQSNELLLNSNNYILTFRTFQNIYWDREIGLSWQIRQSGRVRTTNETLVLIDNVDRFSTPEQLATEGLFNNKGLQQLYHQFSLSYREDLDKRTGVGLKLSALSGILYNKFETTRSAIRTGTDGHLVTLNGTYRSNAGFDSLDLAREAVPAFRNPGVSVSLGIRHQAPGGWNVMGNLKDLGMIRWHRSSRTYSFDGDLPVGNTNTPAGRKDFLKEMKKFIKENTEERGFFAPTDAKAEILIERDLDWYRPNLILSKSLFYPGGNIALVNHFRVRSFIFTALGDYNLNRYFQLGGQALYKTPNFEWFIGSDQLFKTYYSAKNLLGKTADNGRGYTGASIYFGMGFRFGRVQEHPLNARSIPGVDNIREEKPGLLKRLISGRKRRRME